MAWDVAVAVGRRLRSSDGEGGYVNAGQLRAAILNKPLLNDAPSPAVAALLARLPRGGRWSAREVATLVAEHFALANAGALQRLLTNNTLESRAAPHP